MSTQPEALRLADALQQQAVWEGHYGPSYLRDLLPGAAAELRRLHAECNDLAHQLKESNERNGRLIAQRDALLSALLWIDKRCPQAFMDCPLHTIHREMAHDAGAYARAAIRAVEGEKT
jgi:hypothetical protein